MNIYVDPAIVLVQNNYARAHSIKERKRADVLRELVMHLIERGFSLDADSVNNWIEGEPPPAYLLKSGNGRNGAIPTANKQEVVSYE